MKSAIASHVSDNNPATAATTGLRVDPLWREQAACLSVNPELFFPDFSHEVQTPAEVEAQVFDAQVICAGCPVRGVCLSDAIASNDEFAIRGGLTPVTRTQRHEPSPKPPKLTVNGRMTAQATVDEFMHLFHGGVSPEQIATQMNTTIGAIEVAFRRAKVTAPVSLSYQSKKAYGQAKGK